MAIEPRVTTIGIEIEADTNRQARVTNIAVNVEYNTPKQARLTAIGLMVEYESPTAQLPTSDVAVVDWVNELGGSTVYSSIADQVINDATYATVADAQIDDYFEVTLASLGEGYVGTGEHYIEIRGWRTAGSTVTLRIELIKYGTAIASREQTFSTSAETYQFTLTDQEVDLIIDDYDILSIRVTVIGIA